MVLFEKLQLWVDSVRRPGPEAMAVDEWLLETACVPVLRVYPWEGDWISIGYFGKVSEANELFPGLDVVRRWTGGGIVDHRQDWTYTLVVPKGETFASIRGSETYLKIHELLAESLKNERIEVHLSDGNSATGEASCFENPVGHDLVTGVDRKLAGAGQRRTKFGLLHQGSVAISDGSSGRAIDFATRLAASFERVEMTPNPEELRKKLILRYGSDEWLERR